MEQSSPSCSSCNSWWRLPLLLTLVLAAVLISRGRLGKSTVEPDAAGPELLPNENIDQSVTVSIDFGDGRHRHFEHIRWRQGLTVLDAMRAASGSDLQMKTRGSGNATFLDSLDGVENEGAGGRNWTYSVNGKMADRSFAIYELQPGDEVLWRYGRRQ